MASPSEVEKLQPWGDQYKKLEKWVAKKRAKACKHADDYVSAVATLREAVAANNNDVTLQHLEPVRRTYEAFKATYMSLIPKEIVVPKTGAALNEPAGKFFQKLQVANNAGNRREVDKILMEWLGDSMRRYKWVAPIHIQLRKILLSGKEAEEAVLNTQIEAEDLTWGKWVEPALQFWKLIEDVIDHPLTIERTVRSEGSSRRHRQDGKRTGRSERACGRLRRSQQHLLETLSLVKAEDD